MWYLRNLLADLVNVIWFDILRRSEWIKVPVKEVHHHHYSPSVGMSAEEMMTRINRLQRQSRSAGTSLPKL